jgi:hypothetical protein
MKRRKSRGGSRCGGNHEPKRGGGISIEDEKKK